MYLGRRLQPPTDKLDEWCGEVNTRQPIFKWFCRMWYGTVHTRSYSYKRQNFGYFTKSSDHIKNSHVVKYKAYCNSDHYPITFDLMVKCKRRTLQKRNMYNFNRAD